MSVIIALFLVALVFLFLEVFTPGPLFGILGGMTLMGGVAVAFSHYGLLGGLIALVCGMAAAAATLYAELVWLPKTRFAKKFSLAETSGSVSQPLPAKVEEVVGKEAEALTTLAPSGYVLVAGKRYEAFSQSGHVEKGVFLRVVGLDNFRLIVSKTNLTS
jgi:membrane-bound serine protease (ClpP class)